MFIVCDFITVEAQELPRYCQEILQILIGLTHFYNIFFYIYTFEHLPIKAEHFLKLGQLG